jgi:hypothetical protein
MYFYRKIYFSKNEKVKIEIFIGLPVGSNITFVKKYLVCF